MNRRPKVSVILPSLNVVSYIRECVESVIGQSLKDIEIICVDSGSTDGTLEILREYEAKDSRVRVLVADRKSYGLQMNMGMDAAAGEYLGIVETDDWVPQDMFRDLYRIARKNDLDFVKADFYRFTVNEDGSLDKKLNRLSDDGTYYNRVLVPGEETQTFKFVMNTWSGIYSLDFLRRWNIRHNETPGASYQDNGFWFQTLCRAQRAMFVNRPYYMNRRDNPNSSVFSTSKVHCMRDEYDYIRGIIDADDSLSRFIPLCNYFRFCGYYYNTVNRIAPELRKGFLEEFGAEFRKLADACELDRALFSAAEWDALQQIMYCPEQFLAESLRKALPFKVRESQGTYQDCTGAGAGPAVSVIVPVYNVESYLQECLDSILAQSFSDFEVICVNDGSTDSSLAILERNAARDSRIRIISQENGGPSRARNCGLGEAQGTYVCFVDSDDGLAPDALERLVRVADQKDADVVLFGLDIRHYPADGPLPTWIDKKNPVRNVTFREFSPDVLFREPGAKPFAQRDFIRHSFLAQNDIWFSDGCKFGEDTIFQFELFPKAHNITFVKHKSYWYRCARGGSLMALNNADAVLKANRHIQIIAHLAAVWGAEGYLDSMRTEFSEWAVDFFYDVFRTCDEAARPALANDFLAALRRFLSASQQQSIGPGRQECIRELERYRDMFVITPAGDENPAAPSAIGLSDVASPDVSVIVPVHDAERHLDRTLGSLLGQTHENIEVICVDDASQDASLSILRSWQARDARLHVIAYDENRTANQARKDGVLAAAGAYVLFCDADDTLEPDACERLLALMRERPVDVLQFGVNVVGSDAFAEDRQWVEAHTIPYYGELHGNDVFLGCFRSGLYGFNLWGKLYAAPAAKRAFARVEDGCFPRGQDLYAFFLLAYHAQSYRGVAGAKLYNYHLGSGMDGTRELSARRFESFSALGLIADALRRFLEDEGTFERYADIWFALRSQLIGDCVNKWFKKVSDDDKGVAFDSMLAYWPGWLVLEGVARRYWNQPDKACSVLASSRMSLITCPSPRVIGMYYHKHVGGGVERVMEHLESLYMSMGYRVVVITDVQGPEDALDLPQGVVRHAIPNAGIGRPFSYVQRSRWLSEIIRAEHIDVLLYHAWNTSLLAWDMLTAQSAGTVFLVHCHNIFSMRVLQGQAYWGKMPRIFAQANGVVCLSKTDGCFWSKFNANTHVVANPIDSSLLLDDCDGEMPHDENTILWVGRLAPEKHPEEALRVLADLGERHLGTRLRMLGAAPDDETLASLERLATRLGVEDCVEFCGFRDDVSAFYRTASILLCTSEFEGYSLAIHEALAAELPVVMYELPYLSVVQDNGAVYPVEFGNHERAAEIVARLLTDDNELGRARATARAKAREFAAYDYEGTWSAIFESLATPHSDKTMASPDESLMWDTLLHHYELGVGRLANERNAALRHAGSRDTRHEAELVKASASFKIGHALTWPARKVRTLVRCAQEHGARETWRIYVTERLHRQR